MLTQARANLKKYFGYENFRVGQEQIIERVLSGNHTAGIMPTGGGKSICYQIPATILQGITLVISPLISLMKDQVDSLQQVGIPSTFINSSLSYNEVNERMMDLSYGEYKILYIAPERLESESFINELKKLPIMLVAVDEAHCISSWGHDFRPSYLRIKKLVQELPTNPTILALTATATPQVKSDICNQLGINEETTIMTGFERSNLSFKVVKGQNRLDFISHYIKKNINESGIIYAATRKEVDKVTNQLKKLGISVGRYHAGLSDDERAMQQDAFLQDDINVMVATNAFGMGIDKSNVRFVIHYQMPKNMESYYQEAGRAGRDGLESECILLFNAQDVQIQRFLIEQSTFDPDRLKQEIAKLQSMKDYSYCETCLQAFILNYFGDFSEHKCGKCSNCIDQRTSIDITIDAQIVLSCIIRMGERFGKTMVASVLTGSNNKKLLEFNFHTLTTYGLFKERTLKNVGDLIDYLTSEQFIGVTNGKFPLLTVTNRGKEVLLNKITVMKKEDLKIEYTNTDNDDLFNQLRTLRKEIASELGVPPFVVFSDSTLRDLCNLLPTTEEEFLKAKGVGLQKQQRFGKQFIEVIKKYKEDHAIHEEAVQSKTTTNKKIASHKISYESYQNGSSISEIAKSRGLNTVTVENHILQGAVEDATFKWDELVPNEIENQIKEAIKIVGSEKLKPIKEELPSDITYFMIKAVLMKIGV
ncbi:DNA helicase RecQ [Gottfriedia luciferensis]|uniref:DNA helicase RecQ n=1 Tax=Gottfriedia luciferensis TaxID=178774 RepID=UPI000B44A89C|nr:DNA helicase RecQ [Gottfriedia luciferensis]